MGKTKEIGSRALIDGISNFLTVPTDNRDCLVDLIKEKIGNGQNSISLCFRGDYATLYYRCKQLLKIRYSPKYKQVRGFFNFNYARFNPDQAEIQSALADLGVRFGKDIEHICVILDGKGKVETENLKKILKTYMELINDWIACRRKSTISESDRQQQLFASLFGNRENTYFDIEYREPRETLINAGYYDDAGNDIEAKKAAYQKHSGGRFDLLGLRKAENGYILQFVEVKTTVKACDGKAGVLDHIGDYTKYCKFETLVNQRKSDAVYTVNLLSTILDTGLKISVDDVVGHEIIFIFTDRAASKVSQYQQTLEAHGIQTICYDGKLNRI